MDIKNISCRGLMYYAASSYSNHRTIVMYDTFLGTVEEFPNFRLNKKFDSCSVRLYITSFQLHRSTDIVICVNTQGSNYSVNNTGSG